MDTKRAVAGGHGIAVPPGDPNRPQAMSATAQRWERVAIAACFSLALLSSMWASSIGWSHAISDLHGWRQAETAIRAYFIGQGGPWLGYETPVLGPPWPIPHEFPVYQLFVVGLTKATGLPLEQAGRAVSLSLFYTTLLLTYFLLAEYGVLCRHRLLIIALWLLSPLYLFWSRTFMIESTALCFAMAYLTFTTRFLARARWLDAVAALAAGCLAFAVKPPTLVPFACLAGICWLASLDAARYRPSVTSVITALILTAPLVVGRMWHQYADALKLLNHFGWGWTSDAMWRDWVLGPPGSHAGPELRIEMSSWEALWLRLPESVGHVAVAVAGVAGVVIARRRRLLFGLAIAAFLFHFVVFMPLHLSHPYYQYGMALFLVVGTGLSAVALLEAGGRRRLIAWLIVGLMAGSCGYVYLTTFLPIQRRDAYRRAWFTRLAWALSERTREDEIIVGFGLDWNPEVPYYAKRRSLMWPGWGDWRSDSRDVAQALERLGGSRVGALFNCSSDTPQDTVELFRSRLGLMAAPAVEIPWSRWRTCVVYTREVP